MASFPQPGSIGLTAHHGAVIPCQILSLNRDGSATISIIHRSGKRDGAIVPREDLGDPTPLDQSERAELLDLASRQPPLDHRDRKRLEALRLRVAHDRILRRIAPQLVLAPTVAA